MLGARLVVLVSFAAVLVPELPAAPLRVQVPHQAGSAVQRALLSARRRLAGEACRRVLSDFDSAVEHGSLRAVLARRGRSAEAHLDSLVFRDGSSHPRCARADVLAFTSVGSAVVFVCPRSFVRAAQSDPALAEMVLIHEALHTLGLGENPPTSREITARVQERCGDERAPGGRRPSGADVSASAAGPAAARGVGRAAVGAGGRRHGEGQYGGEEDGQRSDLHEFPRMGRSPTERRGWWK